MREKWKATVCGPSARTSSTKRHTPPPSSAGCFFISWKVKATSSAWKGWPSDQSTPSRSVKRRVRRSSDQACPVASHGTHLPVEGVKISMHS